MRGSNDYSEIAALIQKTLEPLISKVDKLEGKIDMIFADHVKRSDLDNLRKDIQSAFILRAEYDPRHEALISRDSALESNMKRMDAETQAEFQKLHERLESGKQKMEDQFTKQREESVNGRERLWIRIGIVFSIIVGFTAIATFIVQHFQIR